jgi:hypothetical protein
MEATSFVEYEGGTRGESRGISAFGRGEKGSCRFIVDMWVVAVAVGEPGTAAFMGENGRPSVIFEMLKSLFIMAVYFSTLCIVSPLVTWKSPITYIASS